MTPAEYGSLQQAMVQIIAMTGERPTILLVHPLIQQELGVSLSLFALEHHVEIKLEPRMLSPLMQPFMAFKNPRQPEGEAWRG